MMTKRCSSPPKAGIALAFLAVLGGCQPTNAAPGEAVASTASASSVVSSAPVMAAVASAVTSSETPAPAKKVVHLAFVGDVSTSLVVRDLLDGKEKSKKPIDADYPFHFVRSRLRSYDVLVGNLECVMSEKGKRTRKFPLQCSMKTGDLLTDAGFDVLNVANNHQNDMSFDAYEDEVARLSAAGFLVSGDYLGSPPRDPTLVFEREGTKIAIVGLYNRHREEAIADVKKARAKADVVIVFMHWGDDFHSKVAGSQRTQGHELIDAGADAIVGAHAHVVQPEEIYEHKLIAYGLGKFVFTGMDKPGTHNGALLELDVEPSRGIVGHRYRKLAIDDQGTPRFVSDDATAEPFADPPLSAPQNEPVPVPAL
jgi:hypothetical protein